MLAVKRSAEDEQRYLKAIDNFFSQSNVYDASLIGHHNDINQIRRMLKIAEMIVDQQEVSLYLMKIAIWLHKTPLSTRYKNEMESKNQANNWLSNLSILSSDCNIVTETERELIIRTVLDYWFSLSTDDENLLLRDLRDVYIVGCAGAIGILRLAWDIGRISNNNRSYGIFQRESLSEDYSELINEINSCVHMQNHLRNPRAVKLSAGRFEFLRAYLDELTSEVRSGF